MRAKGKFIRAIFREGKSQQKGEEGWLQEITKTMNNRGVKEHAQR